MSVSDIDRHHYLPIVDTESWTAAIADLVTPLELRQATGRWHPEMSLVTFKIVGYADTLIKIAARNAFWNIPVVGLRALATHLGVAVPVGQELADLIIMLAEHVLECGLSEEEKLELI